MNNTVQQLLSHLYPISIEKRVGSCLPAIEVNLRNGKYLLDGNDVNYSFGALHEIFLEAFLKCNLKERHIKEVLILGFGAGSIAHILQRELRIDCSIVGVEIDSVILEIGRKYFNIADYQNAQIICADAGSFIQHDTTKYDLIIIDLFIENRVPKQFTKPDFIRHIKSRLSPGGMLFFNRINQNVFQREETKSLISTINSVMNNETQELCFQKNGTDNTILINYKVNPTNLTDKLSIKDSHELRCYDL